MTLPFTPNQHDKKALSLVESAFFTAGSFCS